MKDFKKRNKIQLHTSWENEKRATPNSTSIQIIFMEFYWNIDQPKLEINENTWKNCLKL